MNKSRWAAIGIAAFFVIGAFGLASGAAVHASAGPTAAPSAPVAHLGAAAPVDEGGLYAAPGPNPRRRS